MSSQYGFQQATFDILKKKSSTMKPEEKRGTLLLDEMKLSESVSFNKKTFEINGLTNLGDYTPEHQTNKKGDHALVLMFQPFRGKWVQSLACFLSKDVITTDGATWNRSMWSKFGISKENISCTHMHDESRRLWFVSDFPHLIKNMRNCKVKQEEFWVSIFILYIKLK
ncbi:uncharacterized protein LOC115034612 [Acyrthosiphon pisum]|uniref:Transposable element P transposase-like RNase H domain-containing protein n=1 Tax=Acyrthosiphon pisum TaxID=7029 RepID=A0A8R2NUD9_ACYPI|nr:uncharacterized protein LOC115034612 [Acyrthosiphon pisum]